MNNRKETSKRRKPPKPVLTNGDIAMHAMYLFVNGVELGKGEEYRKRFIKTFV